MEPWQLVIVIAAAIGAISEIYIRVLPEWRRRRREKQHAKATVKTVVADAINKAKDFKFDHWKLENCVNPSTPKKLRALLRELANLADECDTWRSEAWKIIDTEAELASAKFKQLDEVFRDNLPSNLASTFSGAESIHIAIYSGSLNFEKAEEYVLKGRWDHKVKFVDKASGQEKEWLLREVLEGEEFHKFVNMLIKLQDRESIIMLREAQARFIERAEAILKEV